MISIHIEVIRGWREPVVHSLFAARNVALTRVEALLVPVSPTLPLHLNNMDSLSGSCITLPTLTEAPLGLQFPLYNSYGQVQLQSQKLDTRKTEQL